MMLSAHIRRARALGVAFVVAACVRQGADSGLETPAATPAAPTREADASETTDSEASGSHSDGPSSPEPQAELPEREAPHDLPLLARGFSEEQLTRILAVQEIVTAAATTHGVDPALINGLIWVESKFQPKARGPAGAQGLMQLMPKTASSLAKRLARPRKSWDPDFNIHAGTLMLSRLLERFEGDETLALAGYNRGGGTVSKWIAAGTPLPEGTRRFTERVLEAKSRFKTP